MKWTFLWTFALLAVTFPSTLALFGMDEDNRVVFRGLPTGEFQWGAGDTVAIQIRFRRFRRRSSAFTLVLDNDFMRKIYLRNAEISEKVDRDGFYTAVFKLPPNLRSSESYQLKLRSNGLFGWGVFRSTIAESPEFPIASKKDKAKFLERRAAEDAALQNSTPSDGNAKPPVTSAIIVAPVKPVDATATVSTTTTSATQKEQPEQVPVSVPSAKPIALHTKPFFDVW